MTKCSHCGQPVTLHDGDLRAALAEARGEVEQSKRDIVGVRQHARAGQGSKFDQVSQQELARIDALLTRIDAALAASPADWQPIETAPKDGRQILAAFPGESAPVRLVCVRWENGEWLMAKDTVKGIVWLCSKVTLWQPLPEPPLLIADQEPPRDGDDYADRAEWKVRR